MPLTLVAQLTRVLESVNSGGLFHVATTSFASSVSVGVHVECVAGGGADIAYEYTSG